MEPTARRGGGVVEILGSDGTPRAFFCRRRTTEPQATHAGWPMTAGRPWRCGCDTAPLNDRNCCDVRHLERFRDYSRTRFAISTELPLPALFRRSKLGTSLSRMRTRI